MVVEIADKGHEDEEGNVKGFGRNAGHVVPFSDFLEFKEEVSFF